MGTPSNKFGPYVPKTPSFVVESNNYIKEAFWSNQSGAKIKCLLYGVKTVYVCVDLLKSAKGKTIAIHYKEYNSIRNTSLKQTNYSVSNDNLRQFCAVNFTIDDYTKEDEDDVCEYIFEITIDKEEYSNSTEILKVHAVIYIPEIMKSKGWDYAFKSQEDWFKGKMNNLPYKQKT